MAKPIIKSITPFDARQINTITFTYTGNQPYSNKIVIYNAETMETVYTDTESTMRYQHTIAADTLTNGVRYAITVQCFDNVGGSSSVSDKIFFYTFSTPTFNFADLTSGQTVKSPTLSTTIEYSQDEDEPLAQSMFYLYDANKQLKISSSIVYGTEPNYTYTGFDNATIYYIRAIGQTEHGVEVDTGYLQIFVKFENPSSYAMIYANQDANGTGTVNYYTNLTIIRPNRDDYEVKDGFVDLTDDYITYNSGYEIEDDFTLAIKHKYMIGKLLDVNNGTDHIVLYAMNDGIGFRYKLTVNDDYTIFSEKVNDVFEENTDILTVYIRKINNVYGITLFYELDYKLINYNVWFNSNEPESAEKLEVWVDAMSNTASVEANVVVDDTEPTSPAANTIWIGGDE